MSSKNKTTATKEEAMPALVPKLRFPEFRDMAGWETGEIENLVDTITPPKKLPTSNYAATGTFPIIDQSQSAICGWTDDNDALIQEDFPLIVFGDHTCILKLIDRPFAQGADGIKILKSRPKIGTSFLYQFLSYRPVVTEEYKRHYSILKEKLVAFPDFKTGEQQKIAECLSSVDELIAAQARKVDALKTHKKGLMQQLFPREGETQPRLRFPEFQNARAWEVKAIGDVFKVTRGEVLAMTLVKGEASNEMPYPVYSSQTKNKGLAGYYSDYLYEDAITWTTDGANAGDVNFRPGRFYCTNVCGVLLNTDGQANECVAALLNSVTRSHVSYVGNPKLMNGVMAKIEIPLPSVPEQQRIATCLSSLDALITAETQKHEVLKTHKKGLMQQLFPSPEEVEG